MSNTMSEIQLQAACFQWAWNNYEDTRMLLWAVPNGGKRSKREAVALKASGVVAGVWDLHFFWHNQLYIFELKEGDNPLSDKQKEYGKRMGEHGAVRNIIRDEQTFKSLFIQILKQTHE